MMLLPLHDFLSVPLKDLQLVVDNPRSPEKAISMQKKRLRRPVKQRSFSWASGDEKRLRPTGRATGKGPHHQQTAHQNQIFQDKLRPNRWSSNTRPLELRKIDTSIPKPRRRGGVQRSKSSDDAPFSELGLDSLSSEFLRRPTRQPSLTSIAKTTDGTVCPRSPSTGPKSKFDCYNSPLPMRIPVRQESRSSIQTPEESKKNLSAVLARKLSSQSPMGSSKDCIRSRTNRPVPLPIRQLSPTSALTIDITED